MNKKLTVARAKELLEKVGMLNEDANKLILAYIEQGEKMPQTHECQLADMVMNRIMVTTNQLLEQASFVVTTTDLAPEHIEYMQDLIAEAHSFAHILVGPTANERNYKTGREIVKRPNDYCCIDDQIRLFGSFIFTLIDDFESSHLSIKKMAERVIKKVNDFQKELLKLKAIEA